MTADENKFKGIGRMRCSTFWISYFFLIITLIVIVIITYHVIGADIGDRFSHRAMKADLITKIEGLLFTLACIYITVKRYHDVGKELRWAWLLFIFFGLLAPIFLISTLCQDSEKGTNKWGPSPKYGESEEKEAAAENSPSSNQGAAALDNAAIMSSSTSDTLSTNIISDSGNVDSSDGNPCSVSEKPKAGDQGNEHLSKDNEIGNAKLDKDDQKEQESSNSLWWGVALFCVIFIVGCAMTLNYIYQFKMEYDKQLSSLRWKNGQLEESSNRRIEEVKEALKSTQEQLKEMRELLQSVEDPADKLNVEKLRLRRQGLLVGRAIDDEPSIVRSEANTNADENESGISVNISQDQMLYSAACNNDVEECERAIRDGANVNAVLYIIKWTPLHIAAKKGHLKCVELLLRHGARIDVKDIDGNTPLMLAEQENHHEVCDYLRRAKRK